MEVRNNGKRKQFEVIRTT